jgi:hypothetical protein
MFSMLTSGGMVLCLACLPQVGWHYAYLRWVGVMFRMLTSGGMVLCLECLPQVGWCYA